MITINGTVSKSWLAWENSARFDHDDYFDYARRHATDTQCNAFVDGVLTELGVFYTKSNLGQLAFYDRAEVPRR